VIPDTESKFEVEGQGHKRTKM